MKKKIETTHDDVHQLSHLLDSKRAKDVKVPRDLMLRMLRDHAALVNLCRDRIEGDL